MANKLNVVIGANISEFAKAMKDVAKELRTLERQFSGFEQVGRRLSNIGRTLTLGVTVPLAAAGAAATKLAMDAVESENLFEVSMGKMAQAARNWSKELSDTLGLNEYEIRRNVGTMNVMLTSMGMAEGAAFDMAKSLTQLSYDMASFYNLKPEEAFEKLQAAISGEVEPLKRLGIVVNETTVKTFAYTNGIAEQGTALTEQQKILARYGAIMEATSKAQGDLGRTLESPANQLRILKSQLQEAGIAFGQALIPVVKTATEVLNGFVKWLNDLDPSVKNIVVGFAALTAAIGPALLLTGKLLSAIPNMVSGYALLKKGLTSASAAFAAWQTGATSAAGALQLLAGAFTPFLVGGAIIAGLAAIAAMFVEMREKARLAKAEIASISDLAEAERVRAYWEEQVRALEGRQKAYDQVTKALAAGDPTAPYLARAIGTGVQPPDPAKLEEARQKLEEATARVKELKEASEEASKTGLDEYLEQLKAGLEGLSGSGGAAAESVRTVTDVLNDLRNGLDRAARMEEAFGDQFNLNEEKARLFREAIEDLIALGLDPQDERLKSLIEKYQQLGNEMAAMTRQGIIAEMNQQLAQAAEKEQLLGDAFNLNAEKARIFSSTIDRLIAAGVSADDPLLKTLKQKLEIVSQPIPVNEIREIQEKAQNELSALFARSATMSIDEFMERATQIVQDTLAQLMEKNASPEILDRWARGLMQIGTRMTPALEETAEEAVDPIRAALDKLATNLQDVSNLAFMRDRAGLISDLEKAYTAALEEISLTDVPEDVKERAQQPLIAGLYRLGQIAAGLVVPEPEIIQSAEAMIRADLQAALARLQSQSIAMTEEQYLQDVYQALQTALLDAMEQGIPRENLDDIARPLMAVGARLQALGYKVVDETTDAVQEALDRISADLEAITIDFPTLGGDEYWSQLTKALEGALVQLNRAQAPAWQLDNFARAAMRVGTVAQGIPEWAGEQAVNAFEVILQELQTQSDELARLHPIIGDEAYLSRLYDVYEAAATALAQAGAPAEQIEPLVKALLQIGTMLNRGLPATAEMTDVELAIEQLEERKRELEALAPMLTGEEYLARLEEAYTATLEALLKAGATPEQLQPLYMALMRIGQLAPQVAEQMEQTANEGARFLAVFQQGLSHALQEAGTVWGDFLGWIVDSVEVAFDDVKGLAIDLKTTLRNLAEQGITRLVNALVDLFTIPQKLAREYRYGSYGQVNYPDLAQMVQSYENWDENYQALLHAQQAQAGMTVGGGLLGGLLGFLIGGPIGAFIGAGLGAGAGYFAGQAAYGGTIEDLKTKLEVTFQKIAETLQTAIGNVADALGRAFSADTYQGFLAEFAQDLESVVKGGLIRAFMAGEVMRPLLQSLSDFITAAVWDGVLSAEEQLGLQEQFQEIIAVAGPFWEALSQFDFAGALGLATEAVNEFAEALRNVPTGFKVETYRWQAAAAVPMASGGIVTRPTLALIGEAGREAVVPLDRGDFGRAPIHVHIHGDVYGFDDFERKVETAINRVSTRKGLSRYGLALGGVHV